MGHLENHGHLSVSFFHLLSYQEKPMVKSSKQKMNFYSFNLNNEKGKIMEITKNKRVPTRSINQYCGKSHGRGKKSLSKSLFNSIVLGKEIIMKKIKMKKRFGLNRQKSRAIVENVLSGIKAGFKAILNFEHAIERKKMDHQKANQPSVQSCSPSP